MTKILGRLLALSLVGMVGFGSLGPVRIARADPCVHTCQCTVCGWIYCPARGDPANGVAPGTRCEDLPWGWVCPSCGADYFFFEYQEGCGGLTCYNPCHKTATTLDPCWGRWVGARVFSPPPTHDIWIQDPNGNNCVWPLVCCKTIGANNVKCQDINDLGWDIGWRYYNTYSGGGCSGVDDCNVGDHCCTTGNWDEVSFLVYKECHRHDSFGNDPNNTNCSELTLANPLGNCEVGTETIETTRWVEPNCLCHIPAFCTPYGTH